jgi:hypothetical protein
LTLIKPVILRGRTGRYYTNRLWKARCDCGKEVEVRYHQVYYGSIQSCGCVQKKRAGRGPATHEEGKDYGRLAVMQWVDGKGWECVCQICGEIEYIRYTRFLEAEGGRNCPNTTTEQDEAGYLWAVKVKHPSMPEQVCIVRAASADDAQEKFYQTLTVEVGAAPTGATETLSHP